MSVGGDIIAKCIKCTNDAASNKRGMCSRCYSKEWRMKNIDAAKQKQRKRYYDKGGSSMNKNRGCSSFLGVYIAERVLSKVFNDVETMPYGYSGYDFICNKGKKIVVKAGCIKKDGRHTGWEFTINKNMKADYFLLMGFNNREDLNPIKMWMIPGNILNHLTHTSIGNRTMSKWEEYEMDITKTYECCEQMKGA